MAEKSQKLQDYRNRSTAQPNRGGVESKETSIQLTIEDVDADYKAFVDKFKPKKTTDDCYTPQNVYDAIAEWVCNRYGIDMNNIVRPFWPGGDYERYPYKKTDVVVDNPPFSIISKIATFYASLDIPFFLFAPYQTNLGIGRGDKRIQHVITQTTITYENGAKVATAFITNMDKWYIQSAPDLDEIIERENKLNEKKLKKQLPKYVYPMEVLTSANVGYLCAHGVELRIPFEDCYFVRGIDSQKAAGKAIFGAGFLLSERAAAERAAAERAAAERAPAERAAAERAAAERAAAERAAAKRWSLSEAEQQIIKSLGQGDVLPEWAELDLPS